MSDPYQVLGVASSATDEELTRAYRKLAKKNHPDLNPGDKSAEKRMQDINSAYSLIKDIRSGKAPKDAGTRAGGYGGYGNGAGGGAQYGGWWDPFSDLFGSAWRTQQAQGQRQGQGSQSRGGGWQWQGDWSQSEGGGQWRQQWHQSRQEPKDKYVRAACKHILDGNYQQAINLLMAAGVKDAEWHYYCAIANAGAGNRVTAVRLARTAVQMDPTCEDYRTLLRQFEQGGYAYRQAATRQGFDLRTGMGALAQCLLLNALCCCCCR